MIDNNFWNIESSSLDSVFNSIEDVVNKDYFFVVVFVCKFGS